MQIAKQLGFVHQRDIYTHLILLEKEDRYNRFCAQMSDESIWRYVQSIDYQNDGLFGVFNDELTLIGFSHIGMSRDKSKAEFAFSILAEQQGKGLGNVLMKKAVLFAKAKGVREIQMNCLASNQKSQHLARKHGLTVNVAEYGEKTAILETSHQKIDNFVAHNQIILENYFADMDMMRLINQNFWNTLYKNNSYFSGKIKS